MRSFTLISLAILLSFAMTARAEIVTCWDGSLAPVNANGELDFDLCPSQPFLCPDGALVTELTQCTEPISCYFGPKEVSVTITGLPDKFLHGVFSGDEFSKMIAYTVEDGNGDQITRYLNHDANEEEFTLVITRVFALTGNTERAEHAANIGSNGLYQFHKLDGTRLAFEECVVNALVSEARRAPNSTIELETSCKNSD